LFERPEHVFVGHFIGSPGMNSLPCTLQGDAVLVAGQRVATRPEASQVGAAALSGELRVGVRPEALALHDEPAQEDHAHRVPVRITKLRDLGATSLVDVALGEYNVLVKAGPRYASTLALGAERYLEFPQARTHLYCDGRIV
jgi:glycerol transport system ATP-binding protein